MKNILKLATTGSVDDGKSTLIGRLLYDTNSLPKDRLESIRKVSEKRGDGELDLSLITDGLMDEREQGITIDVAHIYFHSKERKFIIADTPGHVEYTRNMITGASQSNVSLILIDARKGVLEQTKRHLFIAHLLRMEKVMIVINKMDLIDYSEDRFYEIASELQKYITESGLTLKVDFIPVSSKQGDNIVSSSSNIDWYKGPSLLEKLNGINIDDENLPGRFLIQMAIRPQSDEFHDFRGYAGKVKSGTFKVGQNIALSDGRETTITSILSGKDELKSADSGSAVTISIKDEIDLSRGNWLFEQDTVPENRKEIKATIAWLSKDTFQPQVKYILQHGVTRTPSKINTIDSFWNVEKGVKENISQKVPQLNDIFETSIKVAQPIPIESFETNRNTGSFILIHPQTHQTVAVGVVK